MDFKRIVQKRPLPYYYMTIEVVVDKPGLELSEEQFKNLLLRAVGSLLGEVGKASVILDVLKYEDISACLKTAILRTRHTDAAKVRSALTLCADYSGVTLAIHVKQNSNHLMGLASNSRTYEHIIVSS